MCTIFVKNKEDREKKTRTEPRKYSQTSTNKKKCSISRKSVIIDSVIQLLMNLYV